MNSFEINKDNKNDEFGSLYFNKKTQVNRVIYEKFIWQKKRVQVSISIEIFNSNHSNINSNILCSNQLKIII